MDHRGRSRSIRITSTPSGSSLGQHVWCTQRTRSIPAQFLRRELPQRTSGRLLQRRWLCGEKECARSKSDDPRHLLTCSASGADVEDLTASPMQLRKVKALRAGDSVAGTTPATFARTSLHVIMTKQTALELKEYEKTRYVDTRFQMSY
jgi:hypothetical protein